MYDIILPIIFWGVLDMNNVNEKYFNHLGGFGLDSQLGIVKYFLDHIEETDFALIEPSVIKRYAIAEERKIRTIEGYGERYTEKVTNSHYEEVVQDTESISRSSIAGSIKDFARTLALNEPEFVEKTSKKMLVWIIDQFIGLGLPLEIEHSETEPTP